jgi:hypothetical protein
MMIDPDTITDEEAFEDGPTRDELLTRSVAPAGRKLGPLRLRPLTSETWAYLWNRKNFYIAGLMGEAAATNGNPVWSAAEFVYIHAAEIDEVAEAIWDDATFKANVRHMMREELNDPKLMTDALPIIEAILKEYFAALNQSASATQSPNAASSMPGKKPARAGKRSTLR